MKITQYKAKSIWGRPPLVAVMYNNMGSAYKGQGELEKALEALEYYKKVLEIKLQVHGDSQWHQLLLTWAMFTVTKETLKVL
mgnify:CR=1 FL=1